MDQIKGSPTRGFPIFELWKEYEQVAMHFNELLMRLRTQSLGAVGAFATVAGVMLKGESISRQLRWGALAGVFAILTIFWIAIWILDFAYYNRLLLGAVKALLVLEEQSKLGVAASSISLSTEIETAVKHTDPFFSREYWSKAKGRWTFYSLVFVVLVIGTLISIRALGGIAGLTKIVSSWSQ